MSNENSKTARKMTAGIVTIFILAFCLTVTSFALAYAMVSVENNFFQTGYVKINLNDGKPIIEEHEYLFEPGMTVVKDFFIENLSSGSVYYRIYFDTVTGGLADVLDVTVKDGEQVLCTGKMRELTQEVVDSGEFPLDIQERRNLTITFHFPSEYGNATQGLDLSFAVCADAVQSKNNPNRDFD
ncbi:MAG: hypothetical protein E7534_06150 [Ruminococcaceae bacterium]|nr:hypothetical protein [Oscillospiraceae bacterium]